MTAKNEPAFPVTEAHGANSGCTGMTLRDYFATHATDEDVRVQYEILRLHQEKNTGVGVLPENYRTIARYMHADAMLKAREE